MWHRKSALPSGRMEAILTLMEHRGPDEQGVYTEDHFAFGMCRLAIMDVLRGHQPFVSEDHRIRVVYNGEIYNHRTLRQQLEARGHRFRTHSDGEVLVHLYETYGDAFVEHLVGMFAVAIWDGGRRRLLLARDHVGQKPLYVWQSPWGVAFSSELKGFLGIPEFEPQLDPAYLGAYLTHRFLPSPYTLLQGVSKLNPGELWIIEADHSVKKVRYWVPQIREPGELGMSEAEWPERLDQLLRDVVGGHLDSDVPMGLFLSGGLDSSLLAALTVSTRGIHPTAWSADFPEDFPGYSETEWASMAADHLSLSFRQVPVHHGITPERLRELAMILDEPLGDPTVLPLDGIARVASRSFRVMLSGEGADEIFAGYAGYGEAAALDMVRRIPGFVRSLWQHTPLPGKGAMRRAGVPVGERYYGVGFTFTPEESRRLLNAEIWNGDRSSEMEAYWREHGTLPDLQQMQGYDVRWFLPDDVLAKTDRIGMAHHLEIRVPFCDYRVVQFALDIPLAWRRHGKVDKRILRQVAERYLPKALVYRPKQGFPTPLTLLLQGPLQEFAQDTLRSAGFTESGWFDAQALQGLADQLAPNSEIRSWGDAGGVSRKVYALLMFALWRETMVEGVNEFRESVSRTRGLGS